eukprot:6870702-Prorocentrum_lima.AAC.1
MDHRPAPVQRTHGSVIQANSYVVHPQHQPVGNHGYVIHPPPPPPPRFWNPSRDSSTNYITSAKGATIQGKTLNFDSTQHHPWA